MRDPYLYPGTEILKNLLGIMDSRRLQEAESDYVTLRLSEIAEDGRVTGVFDFSALCRLHYRIFQDIYEWAGKPRIVNIEKAEDALNGISVEYSDVFDIKRDAGAALRKMDSFVWEGADPEDVAGRFSDCMAELWKAHPFREGNTRTVVTFCAMFIEERGIYIDSGLFKDNAEYMRDALVAASAVFHDLGDRRKPEYLYHIVGDALERGQEIKEDAVRRIKEAGCTAGREQVRELITRERWECRKHSVDEVRHLLGRKERKEPELER